MTDVTENDLRAALKALTDVIAPSIDPSDPLAGEQLRLVVEYLQFLSARVDFISDRNRFELGHNLQLARELAADAAAVDGALARQLTVAIDSAQALLEAVSPGTGEVRRGAAVLAALIRELVRKAQACDAALRDSVERTVLDASGSRIEFERAWFLPLGLDPAPGEVVSIEDAIARAGLRSASDR
ncbi:MAG: hypothetical protein H6883_07630 [Rhodobiaceae bacterium]|nr:hypothetical protein [Rhodobiaceae bacterium]MCC0055991.1 hypothetical protein [Rhodobiaceae bacterium]